MTQPQEQGASAARTAGERAHEAYYAGIWRPEWARLSEDTRQRWEAAASAMQGSPTPAPATPPGVPDSVRALSEDYARAAEERDRTEAAHNRLFALYIEEDPSVAPEDESAARRAYTDACLEKVAAGQRLIDGCLAFISAHPAGQSTGLGAEPKPDAGRLLKEALFACLKEGTHDQSYGGVLAAGGKKAWVWFSLVDDETSAAFAEGKPAPDSTRTGPVGTEVLADLDKHIGWATAGPLTITHSKLVEWREAFATRRGPVGTENFDASGFVLRWANSVGWKGAKHKLHLRDLLSLSQQIREALAARPAAPEGYRLISAEMAPPVMERMAFNLSAEFGPDFVMANKAFALAVYAEAYAAGVRPAAPEARGAWQDISNLAAKERAVLGRWCRCGDNEDGSEFWYWQRGAGFFFEHDGARHWSLDSGTFEGTPFYGSPPTHFLPVPPPPARPAPYSGQGGR